jgi:serine/threonine-protein kinase
MEGRIIAQRYRLISRIGQGGMGSVWQAEHLTLRTKVAIKIIDSAIADCHEALIRFEREAQSAAELRSTHIVQVFDYGVDDGTPYIAMELLDGESLSARLAKRGKLEPRHVAQLLSQVARGLNRAHENGVVHRDLKPENIFIVREGDDELCKVLDFGIAKKLSTISVTAGIRTGTGNLLGTPFYMSPEQALGQTDIDHRSDIWSFAVIAFECLSGARPFVRDTLGSLIIAICKDPLPKPSDVAVVPTGFDEWFARAASRDRDRRYSSIAEAMRALGDVCEGSWESSCTAVSIQPQRESLGELRVTDTLSVTETPASRTIPVATIQTPRSTRKYWVLAALVAGVALAYLGSASSRFAPLKSALPQLQSLPNASQRSASASSIAVPSELTTVSPLTLATSSSSAALSTQTDERIGSKKTVVTPMEQTPVKRTNVAGVQKPKTAVSEGGSPAVVSRHRNAAGF